MNQRMNRAQFTISNHKELELQDKEYWDKATVQERLETITYLRECFYGPEATTGRLQRFYKFVKQQ